MNDFNKWFWFEVGLALTLIALGFLMGWVSHGFSG